MASLKIFTTVDLAGIAYYVGSRVEVCLPVRIVY